jgi:hypothetical protein
MNNVHLLALAAVLVAGCASSAPVNRVPAPDGTARTPINKSIPSAAPLTVEADRAAPPAPQPKSSSINQRGTSDVRNEETN